MNGLEALEKLCQLACDDRDSLYYLQHKNCKEAEENIEFKPYCNGCPYCGGELKKSIEKELKDGEKCEKALEVIKNALKEMGLECIINNGTVLLYGDDFEREYKCKTIEEFDLLKEAMK